MTPFARLASLVSIAALALAPHAAAQERPVERPAFAVLSTGAKPGSAAEALERRVRADATSRLPTLVRRARKIAAAADRAHVLAELAEVEWDRDPALARRLYVEAFDSAVGLRTEASDAPLRGPSRAEVRSFVVQRASSRDARIGRDLLDRSALELDGGFGPSESWPYSGARADALCNVAFDLYDDEPADAIRLGRESLRYGLCWGLEGLLKKLFVADPRAARAIATAALEKIAASPTPCGDLLSRTLLGEFATAGEPGAAADLPGAEGVPDDLATAYLEATRASIERFLDAAERDPKLDVSGEYGSLIDRMPAFERFDAEHAAEARADLERARRLVGPITAAHYFCWTNGDTWQGLEAEAAGLRDPAARRELLESAAIVARDTAPEETLRLAALADAAGGRYSAVDSTLAALSTDAKEKGRGEDAIRLTSAISAPATRVLAILHLCENPAGAIDAERVAGLLDTIETDVLARGTNVDAAWAWLHLRIASARARRRGLSASGFERAIRSVNVCVGSRLAPTPGADSAVNAGRDPVAAFGSHLLPSWFGHEDYFEALRLARLYEDSSLEILAELHVVRTGLPPVEATRRS